MTPNHVIDQFHSMLLDDDEFNEALQRVALEVASTHVDDEEDRYDLAMELVTRVSVS